MAERERRTEVVSVRFTKTEMQQLRECNPHYDALALSDLLRLLALRGVAEELKDRSYEPWKPPDRQQHFWIRTNNWPVTTETS